MIFKDTFEYLISGDWTAEQFSELMKMIYYTRWEGKKYKVNEIQDRDIRNVWRTLAPCVRKSTKNAIDYENRAAKKAAQKAEQQRQQEIMANTNFDSEAPAQPINTAAQPIYRPIEAPQISIDSLTQSSVSAPVNQPNNGYERHSNFVGYVSDNMPAAYKNTTPTITMNEHGFPVYYMPVFEAHKKDFNHCVEVYGDKSSYEAQIGVLMRNYNLDTTYRSQFAQYVKGLLAA